MIREKQKRNKLSGERMFRETSEGTGFEAFVRAAMSTGKAPPPKKAKAKKRKTSKGGK